MAMGLGFLGRGAGSWRRFVLLGAHTAGGGIGGAASGALLGAAGNVLELTSHRGLSVIAASTCALLLAFRRGSHNIGMNRQVPRQLPATLGVSGGYVLWGVQLGSGVATVVPHSSYLVLVGIQLSGGLALGTVAGASFGVVRTLSTAMPLLAKGYRNDPTRLMQLLPRLSGYATLMDVAVIGLGFATAIPFLRGS